jgi:hypothetical protein
MPKRKGPQLDTVELSSGIVIPRRVHDALYPLACSKVDSLRYGRPYKSRDMLNSNDYRRFEPRHVGGCVAEWERTGQLAIRFLGCPYCSVRFYERI